MKISSVILISRIRICDFQPSYFHHQDNLVICELICEVLEAGFTRLRGWLFNPIHSANHKSKETVPNTVNGADGTIKKP
jgi:hypothetical protein